MSTRLVVVLGYSDARRGELHPVCAARLARAAEVTTPDDVVVLSGWARVPHTYSEAELMQAAWRGAAREVVVDPDARTTVENMANALNDVLRVGAHEVLVVTSSWHAPRAKAALRWLLRHTGFRVRSTLARRALAQGVPPRAGALAAPPVPALGAGRTSGRSARRRDALRRLATSPSRAVSAHTPAVAHSRPLGDDVSVETPRVPRRRAQAAAARALADLVAAAAALGPDRVPDGRSMPSSARSTASSARTTGSGTGCRSATSSRLDALAPAARVPHVRAGRRSAFPRTGSSSRSNGHVFRLLALDAFPETTKENYVTRYAFAERCRERADPDRRARSSTSPRARRARRSTGCARRRSSATCT